MSLLVVEWKFADVSEQRTTSIFVVEGMQME
jgi:hypothetical protein